MAQAPLGFVSHTDHRKMPGKGTPAIAQWARRVSNLRPLACDAKPELAAANGVSSRNDEDRSWAVVQDSRGDTAQNNRTEPS
jgi:hypothetical protein